MKKPKRMCAKPSTPSKKTVVKSTFLDLIGSLIDRTNDDALLIDWTEWIFNNCNVRLLRSPTPRLVIAESGLDLIRPRRSGKPVPPRA